MVAEPAETSRCRRCNHSQMPFGLRGAAERVGATLRGDGLNKIWIFFREVARKMSPGSGSKTTCRLGCEHSQMPLGLREAAERVGASLQGNGLILASSST